MSTKETPTKQKTAVIYLRVNHAAQMDDERAAGRSEMQRQACLRVAKQLGCEIVGEFVDHGGSSSGIDRPGLRMLFESIKATPASFVIIEDFARLSRRISELHTMEQEIASTGAQLATFETVLNSLSSPTNLPLLQNIVAELDVAGMPRAIRRTGTHRPRRTRRDDA